MDINAVNSNSSYLSNAYEATTSNKAASQTNEEQVEAVYEKSNATTSDKKATYSPNTNMVNKLKADADARTEQLRSLVEKLISKQGSVYKVASLDDLVKTIKSGNYEVDEATKAQAQKDIAEDGYWGVSQTAERMVSFAKALTGGDPSKIEEMRNAMEKGFAAAEKVWGGKLPEISQKTREAANELFDKWEKENNI